MTRGYRLGKRAEEKEATRRRIVDAAVKLYLQHGMAATSFLSVARTADVAPATVRNHFPDTRSLALAVGDAALGDVGLRGPEIFDGESSMAARMQILADELAGVAERSGGWWSVLQREPELAALWQRHADAYEAQRQALIRAALGPLRDDEMAVTVVGAVVGSWVYFQFVAAGLSVAEATSLSAGLVVPWLEKRLDAAAEGSSH